MPNKIGFGVEVDDGGAIRKIRGISAAFDKLGGKGSGASLFGNVGAKAVAKGFDLISASASGAIGFLDDAVQAAKEDEVSQVKLGQALRNNIPAWDGNTAAVETYAAAQIERGFADDEVRDSIGQLIGVTHDLTEAMALNSLAQDLARAKGIDLATATDIVTKAHEGNGKALKALGIDIGGATDAAGLLDAIQQNVKGSADAWADTTQGRLSVSQAKLNEQMEHLGTMILPVVNSLIQVLANDWLPALGRGWDKVYPAIKAVADILGTIIGLIGKAIAKIKEFLDFAAQINPLSEDKVLTPNDWLPPLKGHAAGGWVGMNGPELAVVGERGPEFIVPNSQLGQGASSTLVAIPISERELVEAVDRGLYFKLRRAAPAGNAV